MVHFPPYAFSEASERSAFQRISGHLVAALPLAAVGAKDRCWDELQPHLDDVYVGCAGCVGVLKDWLVRALQLALATRQEFVGWQLMDQCRLPDSDLIKIVEQIRAYRDAERPTRADVEEALGVTRPVSGGGAKPASSSRKPGKRSAARDPVGLAKTSAVSSE